MPITMRLSQDEIQALEKILVPISPSTYDLHTFSILRNLYGRVTTALQKLNVRSAK